MNKNDSAANTKLERMPTGIAGLDEMTHGGLPRGRATLLIGGAGCGKTVLALQTLVYGASRHGEPGIFVAFEERAGRIVANAATFGWDLPGLQRRKLFFLDAQPSASLNPTGAFDLQGLLAALDAKVREFKPQRIVFDSVDLLLRLLNDPIAERREVHRLHEWLLDSGLSALITAKRRSEGHDTYGFMQFMVDCVVELDHTIVEGVSQRSLRVLKYRGSAFSENISPLVIGPHGMEVAVPGELSTTAKASSERISTGVARLDTMLDGGYHRGASVLVTGSPGTAKTTLSGAFAAAACRRGENVLIVTFDSNPAELTRNLASVHIDFARPVRQERLHFHATRADTSSAEIHLLRIKSLAQEHHIRCLVIDPVSALAKQGNAFTAHSVVARLVDWAKTSGITVVCTSLLAQAEPQAESTPLEISTIADTWLHLSYVVHSGERNRALTIVKSRGTAHSNQVRELILSEKGVTLEDVYTAGGQVLMGALRWEREQAERTEQARIRAEVKRKRLEIGVAQAELESRVKNLRQELELKQAELDLILQSEHERQSARAEDQVAIRQLRRADARSPAKPKRRPARP